MGIRFLTDPEVFHPGLYYSSKFFGKFIEALPLKGGKLLDVGCGTGILSLVAARAGAQVTCLDINKKAIEITEYNSKKSQLTVSAIQSDLFSNVNDRFDYVVINPPYFPSDPNSASDHAWYCGANFEYFDKLFNTLGEVLSSDSLTYMVLSDGCDLERIHEIAKQYHYKMVLVEERQFLIERNFIYKVSL